jgi:methylated-DNA-[protein]-cysteine S-methyltransferase
MTFMEDDHLHVVEIGHPLVSGAVAAHEGGVRLVMLDAARTEVAVCAAAGGRPLRRGGPGPADEAARQIIEYLDGRRRTFRLQLDMRGTAFQLEVWRALARVPYATTVTYGELARRVGRPAAAHAVGAACRANPLPLLVPCHRVLAANGGLAGFSAGLGMKRTLLRLEDIAIP